MRLSLACNFDDALLDGLEGLPVYELYGKVSSDAAGGGRPSFYLPRVNRRKVERYVKRVHEMGIEFNYLLNASCMSNTEYTRQGQRELRKTLDWVSDMGCESVTVGHIFLLQLIKRSYPELKVRISAHRFTDSVRKARFWEDHGADCIVLNETAFHREFAALRAIREGVSCDVSLIVNNSCRTDCAIAGTHATNLSHGSQKGGKGFPIDYHMLFCLDYRLREPVNYVRANWIRPEDLHHYEAMGFDNFKIVERNTPTPVLLKRARAYAERRFEGNLFDLILPCQYPEQAYQDAESRDLFSVRRAMQHFFKPGAINVLELFRLSALTKKLGMLYPMVGEPPLKLDNRKLDGFIDRFLDKSCIDVDCEKCLYCHRFAEDALDIDPAWREQVLADYRELFERMNTGKFFEYGPGDLVQVGQLLRKALRGKPEVEASAREVSALDRRPEAARAEVVDA